MTGNRYLTQENNYGMGQPQTVEQSDTQNTLTPEQRATWKILHDTDETRLSDYDAQAVWNLATKQIFHGLEDRDGRVTFGRNAGSGPRENISLLKKWIKSGDETPLRNQQLDDFDAKKPEEQFAQAISDERLAVKIRESLSGSRRIEEPLSNAIAVRGMGLSVADPYKLMQIERSNMSQEQTDADKKRVINLYRSELERDSSKLTTLMALKKTASDDTVDFVVATVNTGKFDRSVFDSLPETDRRRALTAIQVMRGDIKEGRVLGIPTDLSDDTWLNRLQLGIYGAQRGISDMFTGTADIAVDAAQWSYRKLLESEGDLNEWSKRREIDILVNQAMRQPIKPGDSFGADAFQGVMDNSAFWLTVPLSYLGGGARAVMAASGAARAANTAASSSVLRYQLAAVARLGDRVEALERIRKSAYMMGTTATAAAVDSSITPAIEGLGKAAASIANTSRSFRTAQQIETLRSAGFITANAAGLSLEKGIFAKEFIDDAVASGMNYEDIIPVAVGVMYVNAKIEHLDIPWVTGKNISPAQLKALGLRSMLESFRDGQAGQWMARYASTYGSQALKVSAMELGEEILQGQVSLSGKRITDIIETARSGYYQNMERIAGEMHITGEGKAVTFDDLRAALPFDAEAVRAAVQTACDSAAACVGFGAVSLPGASLMAAARKAKAVAAGNASYDEGISELVSGEIAAQRTMVQSWFREDSKSEDFSPDQKTMKTYRARAMSAMAAANQIISDNRRDPVGALQRELGLDQSAAETVLDIVNSTSDLLATSREARAAVARYRSPAITEQTVRDYVPGFVEGSYSADDNGDIHADIDIGGQRKTIVYRPLGTIMSAKDMQRDISADSGWGASWQAAEDAKPEGERMPVRWTDMSDIEREAIYKDTIQRTTGSFQSPGSFETTDENGNTVTVPVDAIIKISTGMGDTGIADITTMPHETFHAIWKFASETGIVTEDDQKRIADAIGIDTARDGWKARIDEIMAYEFQQYAAGVGGHINPMLTPMDKLQAWIGNTGLKLIGDDFANFTLKGFYEKIMRGRIGDATAGIRTLSSRTPSSSAQEIPVPEIQAQEEQQSPVENNNQNNQEQTQTAVPVNNPDQTSETSEEKQARQITETFEAMSKGAVAEFEKKSRDNFERWKRGELDLNEVMRPDAAEYIQSRQDEIDTFEKFTEAMKEVQRLRASQTAAPVKIKTPRGDITATATPRVVDISEIRTSTEAGYDAKLQGRDVNAVDSKSMVQSIYADPRYEDLTASSQYSDRGMPITSPNGDVVSGNHRVEAIKRMYTADPSGRGEQYRKSVIAAANSLGIQIDPGIKNPAIIAEINTVESSDGNERSVYDFADASNAGSSREFNEYETAQRDAKALLADRSIMGMETRADGSIDETRSADALTAFIEATKAQGMLDPSGMLTPSGRRRIRNAVLAALIGSEPASQQVIARIINGAERLGMAAELQAIAKVAIDVSKTAEIKPQYDIRPELSSALDAYITWRDRNESARQSAGKTIAQWKDSPITEVLGQSDMFAQRSATAGTLARVLAEARGLMTYDREGNPTAAGTERAVKRISEFFDRYIANVRAVNTETNDMFGETPATMEQIASIAAEKNSRYQLSSVKPWPADFPLATVHTTLAKINNSFHDLHARAKSGDIEAARSLVDDIINVGKVIDIGKRNPGAIIVFPHAEESSGMNKIPAAFADTISHITGLQVDESIVQTVRAGHTGTDAWSRFTRRPEFSGNVTSGAKYIIVDDHLTQGGTVAELRHFIENSGGIVSEVCALTASQFSTRIAPSEETLSKIRSKFNEKELTSILAGSGIAGSIDALTESEARLLLNAVSLDAIRNRISEARQSSGAGMASQSSVAPRPRRLTNYQIIGEHAAAFVDNASSVLENLQTAKFLTGQSTWTSMSIRDRAAIKQATGWEIGRDGRWKHEINPISVDFKSLGVIVDNFLRNIEEERFSKGLQPLETSASLSSIITDKKLSAALKKAYGELPEVVITGQLEGQYARWNGRFISLRYDAPEDVIQGQIMRVVQAWIQQNEGFSALIDSIDTKRTKESLSKKTVNAQSSGLYDLSESRADKTIKTAEELNSIIRQAISELNGNAWSSIHYGNIEADNVVKRSTLTPMERAAKLIEDTEELNGQSATEIADTIRKAQQKWQEFSGMIPHTQADYDKMTAISRAYMESRYQISTDEDVAYFEALGRGDMEAAQRMADEAAKKSGYAIESWHGTRAKEPFYVFKPKGSPSQGSYLQADQTAFFFADRATAGNYESSVVPLMRAYLSIDNPLRLNVEDELRELAYDYDSEEQLEEAGYPVQRWRGKGNQSFEDNRSAVAYFDDNAQEIYERARENGNDGIIIEGSDGSNLQIVFSPTQIKSADPVTYDDADNVIPLSQRFSDTTPDIRFQVTDSQDANNTKPKAQSMAFQLIDGDLRGMSNEELITVGIAGLMATSKTQKPYQGVELRTIEKTVSKVFPNLKPEEVAVKSDMIRKSAAALANKARKDITGKVTDQKIMAALAKQMRPAYEKNIRGAIREGRDIGTRLAAIGDRIDEIAEQKMREAIAIQAGVDADSAERDLGIDLAETVVRIMEQQKSETAGDKASEETEAEIDAEDITPSANDVQNDSEIEAAKERIRDFVASMAEAAALAAQREQLARKRRSERDDNDDTSESEPDIDDASALDETPQGGQDTLQVRLEKSAIDLKDVTQLAFFVVELARRRWNEQHGKKPDADPWKSPVALQFLRKTAESFYTRLAKGLCYGIGREIAMGQIAKLSSAPTLRGITGHMEYVGDVIHRNMVRERKKQIIGRIDNTLKVDFGATGRFAPQKENVKRKVSAPLEIMARSIRKAIRFGEKGVSSRTEALLKELSSVESDYNAIGSDVDASKRRNDIMTELSALREFGGLKNKPIGEVMDAEKRIYALRDSDKLFVAIEDRDRRTKRAAEIIGQAIAAGNTTYAESGLASRIDQYLRGHLDFSSLLRYFIRFCPTGKMRDEAMTIMDYIDLRVAEGTDAIQTQQREHMLRMKTEIERIYRKPYHDVVAELNRHDERFDYFGTVPDGHAVMVRMTKGRAIQLMVSCRQKQYAGNIKKHGRQRHADEIEKMLSPEDVQLVAIVSSWYGNNRATLSKASEEITGLGVYSEDAAYFPVKIYIEPKDLEKPTGHAFSIFPGFLTPRIRHEKDFDVTADFLSIWASKMQESVTWQNRAVLGQEMRGIFGRAVLQSAVVGRYGKTALTQMQGFITDILTGGGSSATTETAGLNAGIDAVRGYAALMALGGNVGVMLKQTTSMPAFAFELGLFDTARHITTAFTPDGMSAMREVWNSDQRKNRWGTGNSEAVANALRDDNPNAIKRILQASMVTNKLGDVAAILPVAQGIYRDQLRSGVDKQRAMTYTWMIAERCQQSSRVENLATLQRRNAIGRALYQFMSTQRQYLAFELLAARNMTARPSKENARKLASVVILNHLILPALYSGMGALWKAIVSGGEPPEDWIEDLVIAGLVGPFSALLVFGFTSTYTIEKMFGRRPRATMLPMEGFAKSQMDDITRLVKHLADLGGDTDIDTILSDADEWMKGAFAPYRDIRRAYESYLGE